MSSTVAADRDRPSLSRTRVVLAVGASASLVWLLFVRDVGPADLLVFLHAARAVSSGITPYTDPASPLLWSGHAFVYPYLTAWPFLPLAELPAVLASAVYYVLGVLAVATAVRLAVGRGGGPVPYVVALTLEPAVRALQLGTLNSLLLLGLAVAWRFRRQPVVVVTALVAAVVAKLFLLPMLVWLVLTGRGRQAAAAAGLSAAAVLVGCTLAHYDLATFVRMLSTLSAHEAVHSSSVQAHLQRLGAPGGVALGVTLALAAVLIAAGRLLALRTGREAYTFSACLVASLVLSPIVWGHYFALLVIIPLILGWRRSTLVVMLAVSWMLSTPVGVPGLQEAHRFPGSGWVWGTAATTLVGARLLARWRHPGAAVRLVSLRTPRGRAFAASASGRAAAGEVGHAQRGLHEGVQAFGLQRGLDLGEHAAHQPQVD